MDELNKMRIIKPCDKCGHDLDEHVIVDHFDGKTGGLFRDCYATQDCNCSEPYTED
jgi:hypothetical protein